MKAGLEAARQLAREFTLSEANVVSAFLGEVERMSGAGGCTQFIDLLALKHVRRELRRQRFGSGAEEK
jgi:hypothetical protein